MSEHWNSFVGYNLQTDLERRIASLEQEVNRLKQRPIDELEQINFITHEVVPRKEAIAHHMMKVCEVVVDGQAYDIVWDVRGPPRLSKVVR